MQGWVKLHRCLLDKPIWACSTPEQKVIFITILLLANHAEKEWEWKGKKFICKPGQFITSSAKLAIASGCSRQNVRTALKRFKNYEFLTYESTKTGLLITIVNWEKYQSNDNNLTNEVTNELTNAQPTPNQRLTTNKNNKNDKNDKKKIKEEIAQFVEWFNSEFGTKYRVQTYADKIAARLENFTIEQLKQASLAMKRDPHMMGQNDRQRVYATLEYITRNDKNVDKWLNQVKPAEQPKPQSDLIQLEPWQLEAQKRRREKLAAKCVDGSV